MKISTLIIEDELLARQTLRDFSKDSATLNIVGEAADGLTAAPLIDELKPELIFLDVQMPEISGLEVLRRARHRPSVVFTTAFDNYAVTAFEFEALDYLLKPFGRERFGQTLQRIERHFELKPTAQPEKKDDRQQSGNNALLTRLFVRDKQRIFPLSIEEIVWLEADDDYTIIHAARKNYLVSGTLSSFANRLDANKFLRVHRSAIINLDHIAQIEEFDRRLLLYMSNGAEVQASRQGSLFIKKFIT